MLPTVADLLDRSWAPRPWPNGHACIYKATLVGTTRAYVGKAVDLRDRFQHHRRDDLVIDRALKKHGPENFSIEILWVGFTEADAYAHEDSFIEEHWTPGGYNIGDGGVGWTSEEALRASILGVGLIHEANARRAGYPQQRVLAALEKEPRSVASLVASLGLTRNRVLAACGHLRDKGHHIIGEYGGLFRLVTFEEAANHWASGRALSNKNRALGALMEGPRTVAELAAALGVSHGEAYNCVEYWRKKGYSIECRGWCAASAGRGTVPGTFHLIIDHKRHPWLHLGRMDLRGAAWDDRCNSVAI